MGYPNIVAVAAQCSRGVLWGGVGWCALGVGVLQMDVFSTMTLLDAVHVSLHVHGPMFKTQCPNRISINKYHTESLKK